MKVRHGLFLIVVISQILLVSCATYNPKAEYFYPVTSLPAYQEYQIIENKYSGQSDWHKITFKNDDGREVTLITATPEIHPNGIYFIRGSDKQHYVVYRGRGETVILGELIIEERYLGMHAKALKPAGSEFAYLLLNERQWNEPGAWVGGVGVALINGKWETVTATYAQWAIDAGDQYALVNGKWKPAKPQLAAEFEDQDVRVCVDPVIVDQWQSKHYINDLDKQQAHDALVKYQAVYQLIVTKTCKFKMTDFNPVHKHNSVLAFAEQAKLTFDNLSDKYAQNKDFGTSSAEYAYFKEMASLSGKLSDIIAKTPIEPLRLVFYHSQNFTSQNQIQNHIINFAGGKEGTFYYADIFDFDDGSEGYSWYKSISADFTAKVSVKWESGKTDSGFGMIFRITDGEKSYYDFSISQDGHYALAKFVNDKWEYPVNWQSTDLVKPGDNQLKVTCQGTAIICYLNDKQVINIQDTPPGSAKMKIGICANGGIECSFSDFEINSN